MNDHDRLRAYLAEQVPDGGTDADTLFTNAEIDDLLSFGTGSNTNQALYASAAEGWERKAARYADLVNNQTGGTQRQLSDLHSHATKQSDRFRSLAYGRTRARIGKIVRPGTTIR